MLKICIIKNIYYILCILSFSNPPENLTELKFGLIHFEFGSDSILPRKNLTRQPEPNKPRNVITELINTPSLNSVWRCHKVWCWPMKLLYNIPMIIVVYISKGLKKNYLQYLPTNYNKMSHIE